MTQAAAIIRKGDAVRVRGRGRTPHMAVGNPVELGGRMVVFVRRIGFVERAKLYPVSMVTKAYWSE